LRKAGHAVSYAGTLAAARASALVNGFDVVVSDLGLPDGSGLELMAELRSRYGLHGIALSGYGMDEDLVHSREAGFDRHLTKPVNIDDLRLALQEVTAGVSIN
jgi:DNA-binding response OmpR family regulator